MAAEDPETPRTAGDIVRLGVVESIDLAAARVTVACGDLVTGPIPWLCFRAGKTRVWSAPDVGEQGLVVCQDGESETGVFLPGVYSDAFDAPADDASTQILFEDGAVLKYDPDASALTFTLPGSGTAAIVAEGGIELTGDTVINGDVTVNGTVDATGDVNGEGVSLAHHVHGGVTAGGASTGQPA